jgi:bifunctional enzyme CysN/CysC
VNREHKNGHKALVLWFTGISGSGKSTLAKTLEHKLWDRDLKTVLLDGDQLRHGLCGDLGFSREDRSENIRRVGHAARLFFEHGNIVLCTFVSPFRVDRDLVKDLFPEDRYLEVHVHCEREFAMQRDPKGLYKKAIAGEITGLTGYDGEYQEPGNPSVKIDTGTKGIDECVEQLLRIIIGSI